MAMGRTEWRVFWTLWIAGILATLAVLPYMLTLAESAGIEMPPVPWWALAALQAGQAAILLAAAILLGLFLGRRHRLGAPLLEAWFEGRPGDAKAVSALMLALVFGILVGAVIFALDRYIFAAFVEPITPFQAAAPLWQRLGASFYGGICEELFLRLFLVSLLVWLGMKLTRTESGAGTAAVVWSAILIASILFSLGHLPMTARFMAITPIVVMRGIALNGIAGVVFGLLYRKKGIEVAMACHFSADVVLHVLLPAL